MAENVPLTSSNLFWNYGWPHPISENGGASIINAVKKDVETKRCNLLACGTTAESMRICSICNVICNSDNSFSEHLSGRKHTSQERFLKGVAPQHVPLLAVAAPAHVEKTKDVKMGDRRLWCDVCGIHCNSDIVFHIHVAGKKHKRNLVKGPDVGFSASDFFAAAPMERGMPTAKISGNHLPVVEMKNPGSVVGVVATAGGGANEVEGGKGGRRRDNVESKMQRMVQSGTKAAMVRMCTTCNVVCNSVHTFNHHISGRKHAALVAKLESNVSPCS